LFALVESIFLGSLTTEIVLGIEIIPLTKVFRGTAEQLQTEPYLKPKRETTDQNYNVLPLLKQYGPAPNRQGQNYEIFEDVIDGKHTDIVQ
jgi:hypothetical protein